MDTNGIINDVRETTITVFKSMVFMDARGAKFDDQIHIPDKHLTAMVGFAGSYMGLAAIHCSETFARRVGAAMLHLDCDELTNEDVRDALGEISNMIAGHFKARLAEKNQSDAEVFDQSVPTVIIGSGYETHAVTDAPRYCVKFETDYEDFYVELALKKT